MTLTSNTDRSDVSGEVSSASAAEDQLMADGSTAAASGRSSARDESETMIEYFLRGNHLQNEWEKLTQLLEHIIAELGKKRHLICPISYINALDFFNKIPNHLRLSENNIFPTLTVLEQILENLQEITECAVTTHELNNLVKIDLSVCGEKIYQSYDIKAFFGYVTEKVNEELSSSDVLPLSGRLLIILSLFDECMARLRSLKPINENHVKYFLELFLKILSVIFSVEKEAFCVPKKTVERADGKLSLQERTEESLQPVSYELPVALRSPNRRSVSDEQELPQCSESRMQPVASSYHGGLLGGRSEVPTSERSTAAVSQIDRVALVPRQRDWDATSPLNIKIEKVISLEKAVLVIVDFLQSISPQGKLKLYFFEQLIAQSALDASALFALKSVLAVSAELRFYNLHDKEIDRLLLDSINGPLVISAPYDHFLFYIRIFSESCAENNFQRLTEFLQEIDFNLQNGPLLCRAIYRVFMTGTQKKAKLFLDSLVDSFQIDHFHKKEVIERMEADTILRLAAYFILASNRCHPKNIIYEIVKMMRALHTRPPLELFLSIPFLFFTRVGSNLSDSLLWHSIMLYLGHNTMFCEHKALYSEYKENVRAGSLPPMESLLTALENFYKFYHDNEEHVKKYHDTYDLLVKKLVDAARLLRGKNIPSFCKMIEDFIGYFIETPKAHLNILFSAVNKVGECANGFAALESIIEASTQGNNVESWNVRGFSDRVFVMYCYIKYPISEYLHWFRVSNVVDKSETYFDYAVYASSASSPLLCAATHKQLCIKGYEELYRLGYKVLHNNQLAAVLFSLHPPLGIGQREYLIPKHVFFKVGTGQGKSLIIALTALNYALRGKELLREKIKAFGDFVSDKGTTVYVFTCYQHLAKRDYERFEPLFSRCGVRSQLIGEESSYGPSDDAPIQIVYAELGNFFRKLFEQVDRRIRNQPRKGHSLDFFRQHVAILDEFDSLIMEAKEFGGNIYDYYNFLGLPDLKKEDFASRDKNCFRRACASSQESQILVDFFDDLQEQGLIELYETWFSHLLSSAERSWKKGKEDIDSLGRKVRYVGGALHELVNERRFYMPRMAIDTLAYLTSFKQVIGFSGSIEEVGVQRFQKLFGGTTKVAYFRMPPFFGFSADRNQVVTDDCNESGQHGRTEGEWAKGIKIDILNALKRKQPVLVFADIRTPVDWSRVHAIVKEIKQECQQSGVKIIIQEISEEADVTQQKLDQACQENVITIASHVVGRGADFIVSPKLLRESGGLHVLITYLPQKDNELDDRLLLQMKGRTARMENKGSHSVIVKKKCSRPSNSLIEIREPTLKYHELMVEIYQRIQEMPYDASVWKKWLFLNLLVRDSDCFYQKFHPSKTTAEQADFVIKNILYGSGKTRRHTATATSVVSFLQSSSSPENVPVERRQVGRQVFSLSSYDRAEYSGSQKLGQSKV